MSESRVVMTDSINLERELVERARKGDNEAFEDLVRMYQVSLYRYLCRLSGNVEDAMELTQSSFVKAYLSIKRFRGDSSFKTYLYKIASNNWRNSLRDRGRRQNIDIDDVPIASSDNPHDDLVRGQEQQKFWLLVDKLPARQKEALILRVREGHTFEEVARVMGCSIGSAKASYHHAVGKLKSAIEGEEK
jgi:RNA polymerase sigma-70 factor (ECF subfamily)